MTLHEQLTHEIRTGPSGPNVGAFFDLDQTLFAGFSATSFTRDQFASGRLSHFPFPFFQFYPVGVRARLLQTLPLAWVGRIRNPEDAYGVAQSVNLLTESELRSLFPGCRLYREKLFGLTKSFVAYSGW